MGTGIVYWLMIITCITSSGWISLAFRNISTKRWWYVAGCLGMFGFFINNSYWTYDAFAVHPHIITPDLAIRLWGRLVGAVLGLISTFIFVINPGQYTTSLVPTKQQELWNSLASAGPPTSSS